MDSSFHDLQPLADQLTRLVEGVAENDLGLPTPCADWSVSDLLLHILDLSSAFTAAAAKLPLADPETYSLLPDFRARARRQLTELATAWGHPFAWAGNAEAGGVEMAASEMGVVALDELVLHGWDLARATGQSFNVSESDAAACLAFAESMGPPAPAEARAGLYGPVVPISADAPVLYRLLGASGREPTWAPPATAAPTPDPTFVLVPGAWTGEWGWQDMVGRLQRAGHRALTLTLTGLGPDSLSDGDNDVGLERHIADVLELLEGEDLTDAVLVGHSYSGLVVGMVTDRASERIRRTIYVASFLPRHARSLIDDWGDDEDARNEERQDILDAGRRWAAPPAEGLAMIADLDEDQRRWLSKNFVTHPGGTVLDDVILRAPVTAQPVSFIATAADGADPLADLPAELSGGMPGRWRLRTLVSGHWPMMSVPEELVNLLIEESQAD